MAWYAAHAIMYVRFKTGKQRRYPVRENILLVNARSLAAAWRKAEQRARRDETDWGGKYRWGMRPAEWVFGGLRKVAEIPTGSPGGQPEDGDEITHVEHEVASPVALNKLMTGSAVSVEYARVSHTDRL